MLHYQKCSYFSYKCNSHWFYRLSYYKFLFVEAQVIHNRIDGRVINRLIFWMFLIDPFELPSCQVSLFGAWRIFEGETDVLWRFAFSTSILLSVSRVNICVSSSRIVLNIDRIYFTAEIASWIPGLNNVWHSVLELSIAELFRPSFIVSNFVDISSWAI